MSEAEIAQFRGYLVGDSCSKDPILRHESNANSSGGRHARFAIQLLQCCSDFSLRSTATTSQELSCTLLAADAGAASSACSGKMLTMGTQHCWQTRPHDRPSFPEVLSQLEDMQVHAMVKFLRSSSLLVQFVFNLAASAHGSIRASSAMRQQQSQQVRGFAPLSFFLHMV